MSKVNGYETELPCFTLEILDWFETKSKGAHLPGRLSLIGVRSNSKDKSQSPIKILIQEITEFNFLFFSF